jgi:hypothetical protein
MKKYYVEVVAEIDGNLKKFEEIVESKDSLTVIVEFLHDKNIDPSTVDKLQVTDYSLNK